MDDVIGDHEAELAELAELAGHLNAINARVVAVVADVLDGDAWMGPGIHSPAQWVAWKTGVSPERARDIVRVAGRRADFPALAGAFDAGELSLEQVTVVVTRAPAWADQDVLDIAQLATVSQLRRVMRSERFVGRPTTRRSLLAPTGSGWRPASPTTVGGGSTVSSTSIAG